ncbi:MAG: NAD-dependent epimerase/dehydratase family protein [Phycisphaerae bacterium]
MPKSEKIRRVLVAGASGQLGRELTRQLLTAGYEVRALIHKTPLDVPGVKCIRGNVSSLADCRRAVEGADAVCQLATTKEDPDTFIDVSIRGTYNLLEAARQSGRVRRWVLSGGDAAMGIYFYKQPGPINEAMPRRAYPGCYAFSKVIEEVMAEQYHIQYGLPTVCLRASWIIHRDMILRHFSVKGNGLGVPRWQDHMTSAQKKALRDLVGRAAGGRGSGAGTLDGPSRASEKGGMGLWPVRLAGVSPAVAAGTAARRAGRRPTPHIVDAPGVPAGRDFVGIAIHPDGRALVRHVVSIHDVAAAFLLALANPASIGQTFNIAAPSAFAYDTAGDYLARKTGWPTMRITVPKAEDFAMDISKARAILGYQPQYDIFSMLDEALQYRQGAGDKAVSWKG